MNQVQFILYLFLPCLRRIKSFIVMSFLLLSIPIFAQTETETETTVNKLFNMSIEELMNVKVITGSLTKMSLSKIPVSATVITKEEIAETPARDLLDLIEIYVPSATYVNHWLGGRLGMRGVSGDQNSSYSIIVNGIKINSDYQGQPFTEIRNKDLSDIERIEIIRGPGSVTYGPGAIGGTINIITKDAVSSEGLNITSEGNYEYRYGSGSGSYGYNSSKIKAFLFGSWNISDGQKDPEFFYVDRANGYGYGFMSSKWGNKGLGSPAPNFYENYWNKPEVKLFFDIQFLNRYRFWSRYTTYSFTKQQQELETADGSEFPGLFGKQFISVFEHHHQFSENMKLKSSIGFLSQSHRDVYLYQGKNKPSDHIAQRKYSYSENDMFAKSQMNYNLNEKFQFAIGGEYHYKYYNPEWGMNDNTFILGFQSPIRFAVYDTTSGFYQQYGNSLCTVINDKINTNSVAGFFEANIDITEKNKLLISGRADKYKLSDWAISPRIAWILEIDNENIIKAIYQHSVRLPAFLDLYSQKQISGTSSKPEVLKGTEIIFNRMQNKNLSIILSGHYHTIDQIAWLSIQKAGLVGTFELAGFDAEVKYSTKNHRIGGNYSFIKQLSWNPEYETEAYIDINLASGLDNVDKVYIPDYGNNRINNLPLHSLKGYYNQNLPYNLSLHLDCRMSFDYQQEGLLRKLKNAHNDFGVQESINEMNSIYQTLHDHGYGENSFTSNISVTWKVSNDFLNAKISLFAMNIFSVNHVRYVIQFWEGGNLIQYPRQCGFVEEPVALGVKCTFRF